MLALRRERVRGMLHPQTGLRLAALRRLLRERTLPNRVVIAHARPVILARSVHARRAFRRAVAPAAELGPVRLLVVFQRKFGSVPKTQYNLMQRRH